MKTPGIRVRPLLERLLFTLIVPVTLAFLADAALGTSPFIAVVSAVICIPLASVLVINSALHDMNALIAVVAPPLAEEDGIPAEHEAAVQKAAVQKAAVQKAAEPETAAPQAEVTTHTEP